MPTIPAKETEARRDQPDRRGHVRFIMVNGRTPRPQSFCLMCDQPIGAGYLREIGTHLVYCDHDCYADHCNSAVRLLEHRARAS